MNYRKTFNQIFASIFILSTLFSFAYTSKLHAEFEYSSDEAQGDVVKGGIVPCTNTCDADDVFRLINNLIEFTIKYLVIPVFVFMIMYAGYRYITAMGDPGKIIKLKGLFFNMVGGLVLILCSFLIVKGILYALGYTEGLLFFE